MISFKTNGLMAVFIIKRNTKKGEKKWNTEL